MSITISRALRMAMAFILVLCFSTSSFAQGTAGKITGKVLDKATNDPLPAASIRIEGTPMGSMADEGGNYFILNVPPGQYSLIVNVIGYAPLRVEGLRVQQDFTTYQIFALESTVLEVAEAVTVTADRPLVEKSLTSSRTILEPDEIKALPVVNIAELVLTTAGSIGGNLRGGRTNDSQVTIDGASVTGSRDNSSSGAGTVEINPFMIQELEVKTGTFNAEYVNALAGITSVVTKDGGSAFTGNLEFRTLGQKGLNWANPPDLNLIDAYRSRELDAVALIDLINTALNTTRAFNRDPARQDDGLKLRNPFEGNLVWDKNFDPTGLTQDQLDAEIFGWNASYSRSDYYWDYDRVTPESEAPGYSYLTQGLQRALDNSQAVDRSFNLDKYNQYGRNNRTEKRPTQLDWGMGGPIGGKLNWFASGRFSESWGRLPNQYSRLMNFFAKMTYRPTNTTKLSFSGLIEDRGFFSGKGQRRTDFGYKYILEGLNQDFQGRLHMNVNFTHTVSSNTFYEFRLSHLREYAEAYNPAFGKSPLPNHALASNVTAIGYTPLEEQGLPGTGFRTHGDQAYQDITSGNFFNIRPFKTDLSYSITSQVNLNHQFKAGAGVTLFDYHEQRRGRASGNAPELFAETNVVASSNNLKLSGWEYHVYPTEYFVYAQDRVEYGGLIVNAGVRLDIFDPKSNYINPFRPRVGPSASDDDPQNLTLHPSIKTGLAPRLGISHPITDRAALHYSYGVFNQRPTLSNLYDGLVQSYPFERNHGNPDLPYQKATNYEMGVQAEVYPGYHMDVTGYFRDVDDLPLFWIVNPESNFIGGSQREQAILLPTFASDSRGFEISMRRAMANRFSVRANYTVAFTTDLTTIGRQPDLVHFSDLVSGTPKPGTFIRQASAFDRRHRIVTNVLVELPYGVSASFLTKAQSGNEYRTPNEDAVDPFGLLAKARRSPWTTTTDMYAQKVFSLGSDTRLGVFTQVNNLFNRTNIYSVSSGVLATRFIRRGDPVGFMGGPLPGLGTQGNAPRDIWVGFNLSW